MVPPMEDSSNCSDVVAGQKRSRPNDEDIATAEPPVANKVLKSSKRSEIDDDCDFISIGVEESEDETSGLSDSDSASSTNNEVEPEAVQVISGRGGHSRPISKDQLSRIRVYESRRLHFLFQSDASRWSNDNSNLVLSFKTPQHAHAKNGKLVQRKELRKHIFEHLGSFASDGLTSISASLNLAGDAFKGEQTQVLMAFSDSSSAHTAMQELRQNPCPVAGTMLTLRVSLMKDVQISLPTAVSERSSKREQGWYLNGRMAHIRKLIESGELDVEDAAIFNVIDNASGQTPKLPYQSSNVTTPAAASSRGLSGLDQSSTTELEPMLKDLPNQAPRRHISVDSSKSSGRRSLLMHLNNAARELQRRYWGRSDDNDLVRCPICAANGHMEENCPSRSCSHCGAVDNHFPSACPTKSRCVRCRERGHSVSQCPSKLARSVADGFSCDLCQGQHREEECSWIWRTFRPQAEGFLQTADILLIGCYECGSDRHFGYDCQILKDKDRNPNNTFSSAFASLFTKMALPLDFNATNARGRAKHGNKEDDVETHDRSAFIGRKLDPRQPSHGKIRISGNLNRLDQRQNNEPVQPYVHSNDASDKINPYGTRGFYFSHPNRSQPGQFSRDGHRPPPLPNEPLPSSTSNYHSLKGPLPDRTPWGRKGKNIGMV